MPSWPSITAWMRRRFGREETTEAAFPGREIVATGAQAVVATEALLADGLYRFSLRESEHHPPLDNVFDAPVESLSARGNAGATSAAGGLALSGRRATVFLSGAGIQEACEPLAALATRHVPLVLHLTDRLDTGHPGAGGGRTSLDAFASTGAAVFVARDAQHAVDLSLVARRVSEEALVPCIVAMDAGETAWAPRTVALPEPTLVREYVGAAGDEIETPTPAQLLLFGEQRRRLPAWFDLDHPVAHGVGQAGKDQAAAAAGRRLLFADHVDGILRSALQQLASKTGRPLGTLSEYRIEGARRVVVATGAAIEVAEAVADHLADSRSDRVGVVGVTALRPLDGAALRKALSEAEFVTVLERVEDNLSRGGLLTREVAAALGSNGRLQTAIFGLGGGPLEAADLVAALASGEGAADGRVLQLGVAAREPATGFPAREVHLQALDRAYPRLDEHVIASTRALDLTPSDAKVLSSRRRTQDPDDEWLCALAAAAREVAGAHIRSHAFLAEDGLQIGRVIAAPEPFRDPGGETPADMVLIDGLELTHADAPASELRQNGDLVLATDAQGNELWAALPESWRRTIRDKDASVWTVPDATSLIAAAKSLLRGNSNGLVRFEWRSLPKLSAEADPRPPAALERFAVSHARYDSVPHFWNTIVAPRQGGEQTAPIPDPLLSVGVVPSATAGFHDAGRVRTHFPRISSEECTGCGQCWVACPDSAISSVAVSTTALLDAAADRAVEAGHARTEAGDKLRRAHKQLAAKADGLLAKADSSVPLVDTLRAAFDWLVEKMGISKADEPGFRAAFAATTAALEPLALSVTDTFLKQPHAAKKGSGELVMLAIDPRTCQACGVCISACPEEAIALEPQTASTMARARQQLDGWNRLPDTSGATIARVAGADGIGALAALLMSRHCAGALVGGDFAEPGSGERLALRLVSAVVEHRAERHTAELIAQVSELETKVRDGIRDALSASVSSDDLSALEEALAGTPARPKNLGALVGRLDELGVSNTVDRDRVRALVSAARELEDRRQALGLGAEGFGRARFGLVLAGDSVGEWAARFPRNPFTAPVAVDSTGNGPELARGLLTGLDAQRVTEAALLRRARLLLSNPSDLAVELRALGDLRWKDLTDGEKSQRAPLWLVLGPEALSEHALPGLSKLLGGEQDIKILLVDGRDRVPGAADPVMLALSHRRAFVLSSSIAYPDHLCAGVDAALCFSGPALIHVHAPSPTRHGFAPEQTVERARQAVLGRVQPLLRYDPREAGVYGARLSLDGNPGLDTDWAHDEDGSAWTPARWALGEDRFSDGFSALTDAAPAPTKVDAWVLGDAATRAKQTPTITTEDGQTLVVARELAELCCERHELFRTLQELSGVVTPFTDSVRAQVEAELAGVHRAELDAQRADFEAQLARQRAEQDSAMAARLKARLLELSALPSSRGTAADQKEGS